jgi:hypothetical protein
MPARWGWSERAGWLAGLDNLKICIAELMRSVSTTRGEEPGENVRLQYISRINMGLYGCLLLIESFIKLGLSLEP